MKAKFQRTPFCCGLMEIGDFGSPAMQYDPWTQSYSKKSLTKAEIRKTGFGFICVTRWSDVSQKTKLRAWGFKKVGRWKNPNTGRILALWAYLPKVKGK